MRLDVLAGVVYGGKCSDNWDSKAEMDEVQSDGTFRDRIGNRGLRD